MKNRIYKILSYCTVLAGVLGCGMILSGCGIENHNVGTSEIEWKLDESQQDTNESQEATEAVILQQDTPQNTIFVYLCGEVMKPGVYEISENSRLFELIEKAGGFTKEADETYENLARIVNDGEQIEILTKEAAKRLRESSLQNKIAADNGLININMASEAELTSIAGIGESRAKAIVDYRNTHGEFKKKEDIMQVDGIKRGLYSKIKDKITIGI